MSKKIFLLEDHFIHREVIYDGLVDAGYVVMKAVTREEANEILFDKTNPFKPDLFILDIVVDSIKTAGIKFAQEIQKNPALKSIPILFISAHLDEIHKEKYKHLLTLENSLPKPFEFEVLNKKVKEILKQKK